MMRQSESSAFIRSVLDNAAISSASLSLSASDKMPFRCRACIARIADSLSAFARFSDLSNILLNGAEVEFDAVLEEAGLDCSLALTAAVGLPLELEVELLILRFWKAFLMPLLDCVVVAILVDDDAGDEVDEACLQLC